MSMTLLLALGLGGGYYAYHLGVSAHGEAAVEEPRGGELRPGSGAGPQDGPDGRTEATGGEANGGQAQTGTQNNDQAGEAGQAGTDNQGNLTTQPGSVPEANRRSTEQSQNQSSGVVSGGTAEAQNASLEGNAESGETLFNANCQGCHGANAKGVLGPSLVEDGGAADWQFADFRRALFRGVTPDGDSLNATMPRYGAVALQPKGQPASDQDLADIQAHLKNLK
ncbi:cytochrome c2 [Deinococcus peraridilitoris DSM 19664]|uniref:Cytochrome c2 n=1 Tax=Deinococcus peraridilitoris (strain DSM 19664 / LMG 22246 / CIP 109416 / KR-200) TaxID=937777 RepID=K9ZYB0_DEIPD|nr:cytochrome c2 [Deinococcus peraridilitoris DSM 19664]